MVESENAVAAKGVVLGSSVLPSGCYWITTRPHNASVAHEKDERSDKNSSMRSTKSAQTIMIT